MSLSATPTKKRRTDSPANVTGRAGVATSPRKRTTRATDEDTAMAAFHAAITGQASHVSSPARPAQPVPSLLRLLNTYTTTPDDADPSTPRRPRTGLRPSTSTMNVGSPAKSSVVCHTHSFCSPSFRLCSSLATVLFSWVSSSGLPETRGLSGYGQMQRHIAPRWSSCTVIHLSGISPCWHEGVTLFLSF